MDTTRLPEFRPEPRWRLFLIGSVRVEGTEGAVDRLRTRAAMSLLAYLLLHRRRNHARDELCELFWSDDDLDAARQKLRLALFSIRQAFPQLIEADRIAVRVDRPEAVWCDYEDAIGEATQSLDKTLALCAGSLMPGYYDDWVIEERHRAEAAAVNALTGLLRRSDSHGWSDVLPAAQALVQLDPYSEVGHLALLQGLAAQGSVAAIERHLAWAGEIFGGIGAAVPEAIRSFASPQASSESPAEGPAELFIGRETTLLQAMDLLAQGTSVVTLWGPAGIGKSRLAREVSAELKQAGRLVVEVPAENAKSGDELEALIRQALAREAMPVLPGEGTLVETLLGLPPAVLILDNLEQLVDTGGRDLLQRINGVNPEVRFIVTSQRRLGLADESVVALPPLGLPPAELDEVSQVIAFPSVRLLLERTRTQGRRLAVTKENARELGNLCRELEGNPLAIELAGEWLRWLSPTDVLERHRASRRTLVSRQPNREDRHRSLEAAIMTSFDLLPDPLRVFLQDASIFRGGWDLESAERVCGISDAAAVMAELTDRSLIYATAGGRRTRFAMLDSVRAFASLTPDSPERREVRKRHAAYFAERVRHFAIDDPDAIVSELAGDLDNLRAALDTLFEDDDPTAFCEASTHVSVLLNKVCLYEEALDLLKRAHDRLPSTPTPLLARVQNSIGTAYYFRIEYSEAERWYQARREIHAALGDETGIATAMGNIALCRIGLGDWEGGFAYANEAYLRRDLLPPRQALLGTHLYGDVLVTLGREKRG